MASSFDASLLSAGDCSRVMADASAIEKMAATVKSLAAARVAETELWRSCGDRTPAHHLARTTGTTVGAAVEALETAKRLESLPATAAAALSGALSPQQAAAITRAAEADPAAEIRLLQKAKRASLPELRDECLRTAAAAQPDAEARRKKIHDSRFLRQRTDAEGAWTLSVRNLPEVGAAFMAAITPLKDKLFNEARLAGRREPEEAYAADALAELATGMTAPAKPGKGADAKVIVRVDLDALLRGYPIDGEVSEIAGFGPVATKAINDMIAFDNPFLAAVVTKGHDVVSVAHLGRRASAYQETALQWSQPSCSVEGCGRTARLQVDHRLDWSKSKVTLLSLLDHLCDHHHHLKTTQGWRLVKGHGPRAFVPPEHPDHPGEAELPKHLTGSGTARAGP